MSNAFLRAGLSLLLLGPPLAAQSLPIVQRTLPNGMRVVLVRQPSQPTVSCGWVVRVGSANEQSGMTGMAHLFEHMMFKGSKTIGTRDAGQDAKLNDQQDRVAAQIREELDLLALRQRRGEIADAEDPRARSPRHQRLHEEMARLIQAQRELIVKDEFSKIYTQNGATGLNANTTRDRTFFHVDVPANKLELWAWMESERLKRPVFREFHSERDVVREERNKRVDATPTGRIMEEFGALQWSASSYHWPVIGWPSDFLRLTRTQFQAFFDTYYAPSNISLILVGDLVVDEAYALVEKYFGAIPPGRNPIPAVTTPELAPCGERRMTAEAETTPLVVASFRTVAASHPDAVALYVLNNVLNGQSGRLKRELELKQKAASAVMAASATDKYAGTFSLYLVPRTGLTPEDAEPLLYQELRKIQEGGVTELELQKVKNMALAGIYDRMEMNDLLRNALAEAENEGTWEDLRDQPAKVQRVTVEDVKRVAKAYFAPENRSVLILHRKKPAAGTPAGKVSQ